METNPYSPPSKPISESRPHPRWMLRALILNASLVTLALLLLLVLYVWFRLSSEWAIISSSGDPVVYRHHFWVNVDPAAALVYFTIPNLLLFAAYKIWSRRTHSAPSKVGQE